MIFAPSTISAEYSSICPVIGGDIGFTFGAVKHQGIDRRIARRLQFHMGWKARAADADDPAGVDPGEQFGGIEGAASLPC